MARICFGFVMIILINKPASSFDIFGIDLEDIKTVYNYVNKFYEKTEELRESPTLQVQNEAITLQDLMNDMKNLSQQLVHIQSNEDIKLDSILKILLDNIEVDSDLRSAKLELLKHINHIQYLYDKSVVYNSNGSFSNETLKSFAAAVLSGENSLHETVANMYLLIFPGSNSLLRNSFQTLLLSYAEANYDRLCDRGLSEQQRMYYIFMLIVHAHLKAFTTITQAYSLRFAFEGAQYPDEYKPIMLMFHMQLTKYFEEFIRIIRYFPSDIRRCDPLHPTIGLDVLQFEGLFQVVVNSETQLRRKLLIHRVIPNHAGGSCEDIKSRKREQIVVYNCKTIDSISGCPMVNSNRIVRYSWWKTDTETYGHVNGCPNKLLEVIGGRSAWWYNDVCVCSVNYTSAPLTIYNLDITPHMELGLPKIMKISMEPQMSDVANNMVVVGVKFIVHDDAIHLQIKQSKLANGASVTDSVWKPVDVDNNNKTISIRYGILFDRRNIMNLDDVGIDPKYVVTGVRFELNKEGNGYELNVHGTEYIHKTSRLGESHMWYKPGEYPINQLEYQRNRTEIHLDDPDDSSIADDYHSDRGANKFVQFQHSSVQKDGGYHTVPFFDAHPVIVAMHSPLGGIGLFYRGRNGFGGYIAPRLFNYNFTLILESSIRKWEKFDRLYRHCHDELSLTVSKSENCSQFEMNIKGIRSEIETSVKSGLQTMSNNDPTTFTPRNIFRDDSAGVSPGHSVTDHGATTQSSNFSVDFFTTTKSRRMTSNVSNYVATSRSIADYSTTESLRLAGEFSPSSGLRSLTSNHSVPKTTLNSASVKSTIIKHRNRFYIHAKQRKRKTEVQLNVLRRNKNSTLYLCNTHKFRTQITV